MPRSIPFFLSPPRRRRPDPVQRPPLELILVLLRQLLRARQIDRLTHHLDLVLQLRECVFHTTPDQVDRQVRDVDPDPVPVELLRRMHRRPAPAERIEDDIAGLTRRFHNAFEKVERLLRRIAQTFFGLRIDRRNIVPHIHKRNAGHLVQVALVTWN
jgi:hypothetical protein